MNTSQVLYTAADSTGMSPGELNDAILDAADFFLQHPGEHDYAAEVACGMCVTRAFDRETEDRLELEVDLRDPDNWLPPLRVTVVTRNGVESIEHASCRELEGAGPARIGLIVILSVVAGMFLLAAALIGWGGW